MYAQIINDSKQVNLGTGTNIEFYKSIGMTDMEVEQAYDGSWYVKGYAPSKPQSVKENEVRSIRNEMLTSTDVYMIDDYPVTNRQQVIDYRKYLRDYTKQENWYKNNPITFKQWYEDNPVVEE